MEGVRLRWVPQERLVEMEFLPPPRAPGEAEARACLRQMEAWSKGEPYGLLIDCANLRDTHAGWRRAFAEYFRASGQRVPFAWYNMTPLVRVMVAMFVRAAGVNGKGFAGEKEAREWMRGAMVDA